MQWDARSLSVEVVATDCLGDCAERERFGFTCGGFVPKDTETAKGGLHASEAHSLRRASENEDLKDALIRKYGMTAEWLRPAEAMEWLKVRIAECEGRNRSGNLNGSVKIGVAGPSGGGKTKNALDIIAMCASGSGDRALLFSEDGYYRSVADVLASGHNLDEPAAIRLAEENEDFMRLAEGKSVERERYEKLTNAVSEEKTHTDPKDILIAEGLFALMDEFKDRYDIRVFVYAPFHAWFIRRLMRDVKEGKSCWSLLQSTRYMLETVKPMYERHVEPTMRNADIIIVNDYDPCVEAERCNRVDVQKKYRVRGEVMRLAEKLDDLGAERHMYARQVDHYYTDGSLDRNGEIIRIRGEGGRSVFTYKGPKKESDALERQKLEFEISAKERDGLLGVYKEETCTVEKDRTMYSYNGVTFSLDTSVTKAVGGDRMPLGDFIEVHVPKGGDGTEVAELLAMLGVELEQVRRTAYSEM